MPVRRSTLVIGGARGIGAATAIALADGGDDVTIVDRAADDPRLPYPLATQQDLEATVAAAAGAAGAAGGAGGAGAAGADASVTAITADATDESAMRAVVADVRARLGRLDAVVVTAGV